MFVLLLTHVCAVVDEVEQVAAEYPDSRVSMSVAPYVLQCGTIDIRRPMCGTYPPQLSTVYKQRKSCEANIFVQFYIFTHQNHEEA